MTFKKYQTANNAKGQLEVGISAGATTLILKTGQGNLFPAHNGTTDKDYLGTGVKFDTDGVTVLKRELLRVTKRVGDSLTIVRSAGTCPGSDASTTQGTTAYQFDADDYFFLNETAEVIKDIQDEIIAYETSNDTALGLKLSKAEYQAGTYVYGATSGGNDDYAMTLPISPGAYAVGQVFKFLADVGNTGPATLNINGLGAKTIKKLHDQDLETGDIEAGQIVEVAYDGTNFQMNSQIATIAQAYVKSITNISSYPTGELLSAGKATFIETIPTTGLATTKQNIGDVSGNTRISFPMISTGIFGSTFNINICKTSSPSVNLNFRLETDNNGSPSGTLVDANATATIAPGSLTTSLVNTALSWAGSFTAPTAGTKCWLVMFVGTYGSETINSSNYYNLGYYDINTSTRPMLKRSGSAWLGELVSSVENTNITLTQLDDSGTFSGHRGFRILANNTSKIVSVTKHTNVSGNTVEILSDGGSVLGTATFSGDIATFSSPIDIVGGLYYRIQIYNSSGGSYMKQYQTLATFPQLGTNIQYVSGSVNGSNDTTAWSITTITTSSNLVISNGKFPYISSNLFENKLLSLTNPAYTYKIDFNGISTEVKAIGGYPRLILPVDGTIETNQSGMISNAIQFLSATPGGISSTPGANKVQVGIAETATTLVMRKKMISVAITVGSSPFVWQNTTGKALQYYVVGGTVNPIQISKDGSTYITQSTATGYIGYLAPNDYLKITYSSAPTLYYSDM